MKALAVVVAAALGLALLGAVAALVALVANGAVLLEPPGPKARLARYLTRNVAELEPAPLLPELRSPELAASPERVLDALGAAARSLGWEAVEVDAPARTVRAVAVTRWLRFRDDVRAEVVDLGGGRTTVRARSASRVGRGDLGANARHLRDLREALEGVLARGAGGPAR